VFFTNGDVLLYFNGVFSTACKCHPPICVLSSSETTFTIQYQRLCVLFIRAEITDQVRPVKAGIFPFTSKPRADPAPCPMYTRGDKVPEREADHYSPSRARMSPPRFGTVAILFCRVLLGMPPVCLPACMYSYVCM
jgi:hypothetical protein